MIINRMNFMWIVIRLDLERVLVRVFNILGEEITGFEIISLIDILSVDTSNELSYIPEEILLKDSFSSDTKFNTKCV